MKKLSFILLSALFVLNSCQKEEGCTDADATNYDANAEVNDGSCTYETEGYVHVSFRLFSDSAAVALNQYTEIDSQFIWLENFQFYLSNFSANGASQASKNPIAFIDFSEPDNSSQVRQFTNDYTFRLSNGRYSNLNFGIGVVDTLNKKDPSLYDVNHPLSGFRNMYWSWNTMYIFAKAEGRVDTNRNAILEAQDVGFFVHSGLDSLYRTTSFSVPEFLVTVGDTTEIEVAIHLNTLFDGINLTTLQSHTLGSEEVTIEFVDNFSNAFGPIP